MVAVFRPWIDTLFSSTSLQRLGHGRRRIMQKPIVSDEEEEKENPPPTTPLSVRPIEPPRLLRSRNFGAAVYEMSE